MSLDAETIAAFADGELSPIETARVARAIAADPALAAQVEAHQSLRNILVSHYAPLVTETVPDRLSALLKADERVVDIAQARAERTQRFHLPIWTSGAIAASLVLGVGIGTQLPKQSNVGTRDGAMVAQGTLDRALDSEDLRDTWDEYRAELSGERRHYIKEMRERGYRYGTVTIED